MTEWHIASAVVHALPPGLAAMDALLPELPGVEVHAVQDGKAVLSLEGASERVIADHLARLQLTPGVLSAVLVYHHVLPAAEAGLPASASPSHPETTVAPRHEGTAP